MMETHFYRSAYDETVIFVCVDGAPREACRTTMGPGGSLTFETELRGVVVASSREELRLDLAEGPVTIRHLLPSAIDLSPLLGCAIELRVAQQYVGRGRATIDAEVRDSTGRLVLWAHDGRIPPDRTAHGLALRGTSDADGRHRLAVGHGGGVALFRAPDLGGVQVGGDLFHAIVVRVGADDVSFVLLRA